MCCNLFIFWIKKKKRTTQNNLLCSTFVQHKPIISYFYLYWMTDDVYWRWCIRIFQLLKPWYLTNGDSDEKSTWTIFEVIFMIYNFLLTYFKNLPFNITYRFKYLPVRFTYRDKTYRFREKWKNLIFFHLSPGINFM